jgi:outer membrane usher protein FimD/PapC
MERLAVKQAAGQLVWETREVAPGLYHVALVVNGQRMQTEKLIVKP